MHMKLHVICRLRCLLLVAVIGYLGGSPAQAAPGTVDERERPDLVSPVLREASSVVSITTVSSSPPGGSDVFPDEFLPSTRRRGALRDGPEKAHRPTRGRSIASGLIVGSQGDILTNAHVVADAEQVTVRLSDARQFSARVVGLDRTTDVALLKIDAVGLPSAVVAKGQRPTAGEWVLAIGSPFGLDNSVTAGIVSAAERLLPGSIVPLIQTDVAINPGSSGGPLLNLRGEVIGLNSMLFSLTGGYMGVSFALPIDVAMKIADELRSHGRVSRGQLGAKTQALTPELARSFGWHSATATLILRVVPGSPAERGGLRSGDIVTGIGPSTDATFRQLQQEIAATRPGQPVSLNVWRHRAMLRIQLIVSEATADLPMRVEPQARQARSGAERLGLNLAVMSSARREQLGLDAGLPVLQASGAAADSGVQPDDIIVAVGDQPVHSIAEFDTALANVPEDRPVALLVLRGDIFAYFAVEHGR